MTWFPNLLVSVDFPIHSVLSQSCQSTPRNSVDQGTFLVGSSVIYSTSKRRSSRTATFVLRDWRRSLPSAASVRRCWLPCIYPMTCDATALSSACKSRTEKNVISGWFQKERQRSSIPDCLFRRGMDTKWHQFPQSPNRLHRVGFLHSCWASSTELKSDLVNTRPRWVE